MSDYPVRRNTVLLALCLTALSGMLQLVVAVATVTLVLVTGVESILGLGPAIFLTFAALTAFPAGRARDRFGWVPVLAGGFLSGIAGCLVTALGCSVASSPLVILGFALVGASSGTVQLTRTAAADIYPSERRARGISYVLLGALAGALLGPLLWRPLFAGRDFTLDGLVVPWLVAAGISAVGLLVALSIRPDPRRAATAHAVLQNPSGARTPAAPLGEILRRPGVGTAMLAAFASFGVMVAVMNLSGYVAVGHHHRQADIFTIISAHIAGMYALVLGVGELIDRVGRRHALVAGLVVMAASTLGLVWFASVLWMSVSLFGLGLGWNLSYVAAAAELTDYAAPAERGKLVGFSDLLSGLLGASLALLGGVTYSELGVGALAVGATAFVVAPALWIALVRRAPQPVVDPAR